MKLSIIVPVYNVENHLERCLESIAVQMRNDYELILVDDGSTDQSGSMCDAFARELPEQNVVVVHQSNGGLSAARNAGIERARGEYLTFVDSDDYIEPHSLAPNVEFLLAHPEVDMLEYPIEVYACSPEAHKLLFFDAVQCIDVFADWVRREGYLHSYVCNKIFRARVWQTVHFPIGVSFEDGAVMPTIVQRCRQVYYSSHGCYHYVKHSGSISTSYSYAKLRQLYTNNQSLYMLVKDDASLRREALRLWYCCLNQLIDMGRVADVDSEDYRQIVSVASLHHPSYVGLVRVCRKAKLLPLPVLGLSAYLRLYLLLAPPLR